jgi:hypothetical protein
VTLREDAGSRGIEWVLLCEKSIISHGWNKDERTFNGAFAEGRKDEAIVLESEEVKRT